ncbi:3-oxoadipate enol-lactonase [soil metagenome]
MSPSLHSVIEGNGPLLVLSHALGLDLSIFDAVADTLKQHFKVLRYDHRSHGRSPAVPGPWTIDDLADDAADLIKTVGQGERAHFAGVSMGGMTAQALAARHPHLTDRLVIINSSSFYPDRTPWAARVETVRNQGLASIADGAIDRWLTAEFRATAEGSKAAASLRQVLMANSATAYADACEAVAAIDFRASNCRVQQRTLVIAGLHDQATPPAMSREIAETIENAELATIDAAHISSVEKPVELAGLIRDFLTAP